ncbi:AAA family ATPase [Clostridium botulinum]|nr:AAA family ATPase [Clostridium botulinum]
MMKRFNTTGLCVPKKHYMVDISNKLDDIEKLVDNEAYFVINRPRQFGKTTTLNELYKRLKNKYIVIKLDFERMSEDFASSKIFCNSFVKSLSMALGEDFKEVDTLNNLAYLISDITKDKDIVLMIDEVDRISNNQLFVNFLGILRSLYLDREAELTTTFKSVILAGVYDIKNLKLKFSDNTDTRYNSPWNIAVDFDINMSFNINEIETMLIEYNLNNNLDMDTRKISKEIYKFTNGYPFLVSRLCQIIDEKILKDNKRIWEVKDIYKAVKLILTEHNTLFDDLIKNLENNRELKEFMFNIIMNGEEKSFNIHNKTISIGSMFGYFKQLNYKVSISNLIFSEVLYNYFASKVEEQVEIAPYNLKSNFTTQTGLDFKKILLRFQQFIKEQYSTLDSKFIEREGRLLFLAFIKPIINGVGFDFKEVQVSEEKRLDIVVTYLKEKYLVELKIWRGEEYHEKGLKQLYDYLEIEDLDIGYLLVFNFNKNKEYSSKEYKIKNKSIFEVFV